MLESPPPGRPAARVAVAGKEIAGWPVTEIPVVAGDMHYPFIARVPLEQLLAVSKERRVRYAVVFENDGALGSLKHPLKTCRRPQSDTQIGLRIVPVDFAFPIDLLDDGSRCGALLRLTSPVGARTVSYYEQVPWA